MKFVFYKNGGVAIKIARNWRYGLPLSVWVGVFPCTRWWWLVVLILQIRRPLRIFYRRPMDLQCWGFWLLEVALELEKAKTAAINSTLSVYLQCKSSITIASLGSVNFVLTAWQVKIASKSFLDTDGQITLFSITSPALFSYSSSTIKPFTSQRTVGWGCPPTVLQVNVISSPSSCGPTEPFRVRPHLSRIVGCSGGTIMEESEKWCLSWK